MKFRDLLHKINQEKQNPAEYLSDNDNFRFEVANLITEARIYAELTQEQLSQLIQTKQPSIARWEAGTSLPSLRSLKRIADAIGTYLLPPKFGFMQDVKIEEKALETSLSSDRVQWYGEGSSYIQKTTSAQTKQVVPAV